MITSMYPILVNMCQSQHPHSICISKNITNMYQFCYCIQIHNTVVISVNSRLPLQIGIRHNHYKEVSTISNINQHFKCIKKSYLHEQHSSQILPPKYMWKYIQDSVSSTLCYSITDARRYCITSTAQSHSNYVSPLYQHPI